MDRKQFLATTFSAGLGLAVMPGLLSCAATTRAVYEPFLPASGDLKKVEGTVSRFTNRGGTVGLLKTKDGFVVIDSQFPDAIQPPWTEFQPKVSRFCTSAIRITMAII